jgi:sporulation protein YlmC with PRC-barrel domain
MARIKFSELSGKDVISQDGRDLGAIVDLVFDASGWNIHTLVVKLARDLLEQFHMKRPLFGTQTIQIPTAHVSGVGDKVILLKTLEELTALVREDNKVPTEPPKPAPAAKPSKPAEAKAPEHKPAEARPAEQKPADIKPVEAKAPKPE